VESFVRAFFTPEVEILGYRLKPYCMGHSLLLDALDSPFNKLDGDIFAHDLIVALKVCSSSYPFQPSLDLTSKDYYNIYRFKLNKKLLLKHCSLFQEYKNSHHNLPEYWQKEGDKVQVNSPLELSHILSLMKAGFQFKESWEMSVGLAGWISASLSELNGANTTFTDPLEQEFEDLVNVEMTEDELYKQALEDLGPVGAKKFMEARANGV